MYTFTTTHVYLCTRNGMSKYLPGYYVPGHAAARGSRLHLQHGIMYHDARRALRTGAHFVVRALVRLPRAGENAKAQPRASVRFARVLQKTGPVHLPRSQSGPGSAESLSQQGRSIAGGPSQRRSNVPRCLKCRSTSVQCTPMRLAENPHVTAIRLHLCAHCHAHPAPGKSSRTPPLTPTMMEPCRSSDFCPFGAAFIFMAHRLAVLAGRARGRPRVAMRTSLAPTGCVGPGNCATAP